MLFRTTTTDAWVPEGRTTQALSSSAHPFLLFGDVHASTGHHESGSSNDIPQRAAERPRRVLLVDDDEDILAIMVPFLEEEGFHVTTAMSGREALQLVEGDKPDVVILDLMMPVVSGWDVWDHMQQSPELSRIPVVVFTACGLGPGAFGRSVPVVRKGAGTEEILEALSRSMGAP
jgi:PleD family two-component response regulator